MALQIRTGDLSIQIIAEPLTQTAFAPFGDVISNPSPNVHPSSFASHSQSLPSNAVPANQGFAIQYRNVSRIKNLYHQAPSGKADAVMSVFSCAARDLTADGGTSKQSKATSPNDRFVVRYLERHPFTTQTFTPIKSTASQYLVIVAPSAPTTPLDEFLPVPEGDGLPGRGLPSLQGLRAFVATSDQAVTYGAGTWHAPMVVLGQHGTTLDFVVSQFMSGVSEEDCQLLEYFGSGPEPRLDVSVPRTRRLEKL